MPWVKQYIEHRIHTLQGTLSLRVLLMMIGKQEEEALLSRHLIGRLSFMADIATLVIKSNTKETTSMIRRSRTAFKGLLTAKIHNNQVRFLSAWRTKDVCD
jgi:hypothetical protein